MRVVSCRCVCGCGSRHRPGGTSGCAVEIVEVVLCYDCVFRSLDDSLSLSLSVQLFFFAVEMHFAGKQYCFFLFLDSHVGGLKGCMEA